MACGEFEDRLIARDELDPAERARLDVHIAHCAACRESLESLAELDAALVSRYWDVQAPPSLRAAVNCRISRTQPIRISLLPCLLDWLGWSAMLAAGALVVHFYLPPRLMEGLPANRPASQMQQRLDLRFGDGQLPFGHHL